MNNEIPLGTGFLCNIKGHSIYRKGLITAYHVLGENYLQIGSIIKLTFDDNNEKIKTIKINNDNKRRIYANEEYDITIVEILETDDLKKYNYLDIDDAIYNDVDFNKEYSNKNIYILHYPNGLLSSLSVNTLIKINKNDVILHLCSTEHGSSGAPILSLDTFKVIGVHRGNGHFKKDTFKSEEIKKQLIIDEKNEIFCNFGSIIKEPIKHFIIKDNKIILTLKVDNEDINKKVYFLQNYDNFYGCDNYFEEEKVFNERKRNHILNLGNFVVLINDNLYQSKKYFIPKKEGIYHIRIFIDKIIEDCFGLFFGCIRIINIDLSSFDTKNVTNMSSMFFECWGLKSLDLSFLDTKNVSDMSYMFYNYSKLKNLDLSYFNTKNVKDMSCMFDWCSILESIKLSSFDTKNVTNMSSMFRFCKNLVNLDLSSFDTKNVTNMRSMFQYCHDLVNLDLSSFDIKIEIFIWGMFDHCKNLKNVKCFNGKIINEFRRKF